MIQFAKYIAKLVTFLFVNAMNAIWPPMYLFSKRDQFSRHCKWFYSQDSTAIVLSHFCNVLLLHTFFPFVLFCSGRWTRIIVILLLLEVVPKDMLIVMLINFSSDVLLLIYHKQKNHLHIITFYVGYSKRKWKIIQNTKSIYHFILSWFLYS